MHEILVSNHSLGVPKITLITPGEATALQTQHPGYAISGDKWTLSRAPGENGVAFYMGVGGAIETPNDFRELGAHLARIPLDVDVEIEISGDFSTAAFVEGAALGGYRFQHYRSSPAVGKRIIVVSESSEWERSKTIARNVNIARDLINMPANDLWPQRFAEISMELAGKNLEVEIWGEDRLEAERCGGILGVGRGSARPPRLVRLSYGSGGEHFSLVGKGITFDTGGLSIKPAEGMVGMKYDMAGAATALAATLCLAQLGANVRVDAYLCLAENMPSGTATRPGDVIRARNGKTIEVLNTDAEGRLVMADGLSLASETNPDHIIDIATLTGAATIALGNRYAGLMGTGSVVERLIEGSAAVGEALWRMPLPDELRKLLDSDIADIANVKIGNRAGGMLIAGQFLRDFVTHESGSWGHLDIAGPANNSGSPYSVNPSGATGVMVRTLVQTLNGSSR